MRKSKVLLFTFSLVVITGCVRVENKEAPLESKIKEDPLPSWSELKAQRIIDYVSSITSNGGEDFIPETDRIAVFDNDGTLWTEQPVPNQLAFALDKIKSMESLPDELQGKPSIEAVRNGDMNALKESGMEGLMEIVAVTHSGITTTDYDDSVEEWISNTKDKKFDKT